MEVKTCEDYPGHYEGSYTNWYYNVYWTDLDYFDLQITFMYEDYFVIFLVTQPKNVIFRVLTFGVSILRSFVGSYCV